MVRLEERRTLIAVVALGALATLGAVLFLPGMYVLGLWLAPPMPVAEPTSAPPMIRDALWARADGGRATELRPINPISFVRYSACHELAVHSDDPRALAERRAECHKHLPAIRGVEYLSNLHMRDHRLESSFRMGASKFATTIWLTRSWTKEDFLNTLALRGDFGYGWRGAEAAALGYFGRPAAELDLSQAAFIASRIGDLGIDPWCAPVGATTMRNRTLEKMRNNGVIDDDALHAAAAAPLELAPAPVDHRCDS